MARTVETRSYRFDAPDTGGVFLGMGWAQCALVGGGLALSVLALTIGLNVVVAALPVVAGGSACVARVRGRAAWEWLSPAVAWAHVGIGRKRRWLADLPLLLEGDDASAQLPACLGGIGLLDLNVHSGRVGAVLDQAAQTITVVLPASTASFLTLSETEQDRLLHGWGDAFGQYAAERSPVVAVGWSHSSGSTSLARHVAWRDDVCGQVGLPAAAESYAQLLSEAAGELTAHETFLFVSVRSGRSRRGPDFEESELTGTVANVMESLRRSLDSAGIALGEALSASQLRALLRCRIDPFREELASDDGGLAYRLGLIQASASGPLAVEAHWDSVRTDGSWHRVYWIAGYPRSQQPAAWLEPLLSAPGVARSTTMYFLPVTPYRSHRRIERELVKLGSDAELKQERGRRVNAKHNRATEALLEREAELVSGYPEVGYTGLVCVSASDEPQLIHDSHTFEQLARDVGIDLRLLEARQDLAWASSLPFGLAPKHLLP